MSTSADDILSLVFDDIDDHLRDDLEALRLDGYV